MKNKNRFIKKWNAIPGLSAKNTQYFHYGKVRISYKKWIRH